MSIIKINDMSHIGIEMFQDSETFLDELTDDELYVLGGIGVNLKLVSPLFKHFKKYRHNPIFLENYQGNMVGQTVNARTANNFNSVAGA